METYDYTAESYNKDDQKNNCCNRNNNCDTKLFRIRLLGHCIFCLRKTTKSRESEVRRLPKDSPSIIYYEHVPSAAELSSTSLLSTFSRFWPYFQNTGNNYGLAKVDNIFQMPEDEILRGRSATTFSRLPRMCQFCADKLQSVDTLWRDLMGHVKELRATVQESHYGGVYSYRAENFEKSLINSTLERDAVGAILEFLKIRSVPVEMENSFQDIENHTPCESSTTQPNPDSVIDISDRSRDHLSSFTIKNKPTVQNTSPQIKKLYRQNYVEGRTTAIPCRKPICQQSSDYYTSNENDTSLDQFEGDDGEQADDESGPEYLRLKPSDDDDEVKTFSVEATGHLNDYQCLPSTSTEETNMYENLTGASFSFTGIGSGQNKYSNTLSFYESYV